MKGFLSKELHFCPVGIFSLSLYFVLALTYLYYIKYSLTLSYFKNEGNSSMKE